MTITLISAPAALASSHVTFPKRAISHIGFCIKSMELKSYYTFYTCLPREWVLGHNGWLIVENSRILDLHSCIATWVDNFIRWAHLVR